MEVDSTTFNEARIVKLYGTKARKGNHTPERPHRRSQVLEVPRNPQPVGVERLWALAALCLEPEQTEPASSGFDLNAFLRQHNIPHREKPWPKGELYELDTCPFNPEHRGSARAVKLREGGLHFGCFHLSCADKSWGDFRRHFEPDYTAGAGGRSGKARGAATQTELAVSIALRSAELFHTADGEAFADIRVNGHRETHKVRFRTFSDWLGSQCFRQNGFTPKLELEPRTRQNRMLLLESRSNLAER